MKGMTNSRIAFGQVAFNCHTFVCNREILTTFNATWLVEKTMMPNYLRFALVTVPNNEISTLVEPLYAFFGLGEFTIATISKLQHREIVLHRSKP
jgi:hypothetical protein